MNTGTSKNVYFDLPKSVKNLDKATYKGMLLQILVLDNIEEVIDLSNRSRLHIIFADRKINNVEKFKKDLNRIIESFAKTIV